MSRPYCRSLSVEITRSSVNDDLMSNIIVIIPIIPAITKACKTEFSAKPPPLPLLPLVAVMSPRNLRSTSSASLLDITLGRVSKRMAGERPGVHALLISWHSSAPL